MENPQIVRDALEELQRREAAAAEQARADAIVASTDLLTSSDYQTVLGNPEGDVTLVEFFDYNCSYCKRAYGDMRRLMDEDPNLRIVLKEFPVLGPGSVEAARIAAAVSLVAPEQYGAFHEMLLDRAGRVNEAAALAVVDDIGVNSADILARLEDPQVMSYIEEAYMLADRLGLTGTPSYVVGNRVVIGAVGYDRLKSYIEEVRTCGGVSC